MTENYRITFKLQPTKWFGEPWNPNICKPEARVDVPVDAFCMHCTRPILERDQGLIHAVGDWPSDCGNGSATITPVVRSQPVHLDCFLHSVGIIPCSPRFHPPTKETLS